MVPTVTVEKLMEFAEKVTWALPAPDRLTV